MSVGGRPPWVVLERGRLVDLWRVNTLVRATLVCASAQIFGIAAFRWFNDGPLGYSPTILLWMIPWVATTGCTAALAGYSHGALWVGILIGVMAGVPLLGLVVTAMTVHHGMRTIASRGVPMGWFGATWADFKRLSRGANAVCVGCGYSLAGLAGDVCPECGASAVHEGPQG